MICESLYPYAGLLGVSEISDRGVQVMRAPDALYGSKLSLRKMVEMTRSQSATLCRLAAWKAEKEAR